MSRTGTDLGNKLKISIAQSIILFFIFYISITAGSIQIDDRGSSYLFLFIAQILLLPFISVLSFKVFPKVSIYLESLEILMFLMLLLVFLKFPAEAIMLSIAILLSVLKISNPRKDFPRVGVFMAISFLMYFLGESVQFIIQPRLSPVVMIPLKYVYILPGELFPWIYRDGINLYGSVLTLTTSPLVILIFSAIAIISTDNFFRIYGLVNGKRGAGMAVTGFQGAAASLSCQCEGCIAVLPSVSAAILTVAMIPLIMESFILLILTNVITGMVTSRYGAFSSAFSRIISVLSRYLLVLVLISIPIISSILAMGGYFRTPIFIFGLSMAGAFAGYLMGSNSVRKRFLFSKCLKSLLIVAGLTGILIWYVPSVTYYLVNFFPAFLFMSFITLVSGFLLGVMRWQIKAGYLVGEIATLAIGVLDISLFYLSLEFRFNPWAVFSYSSLLFFELISWGIMVPAMWISTQQTLIGSSRLEISSEIADSQIILRRHGTSDNQRI